MKLIDTHCHLDFEPLSEETAAVINRAHQASVVGMITVGTSLLRSREVVAIAKKYPNVWASVGFHPQDIAEIIDIDQSIAQLEELALEPEVVAIGEIGLDYYSAGMGVRGSISTLDKKKQQTVLRSQLDLAERFKKPVIFHVRDAWEDFFETLENFRIEVGHYPQGVIHCFTGEVAMAKKALKMGLYIGFTGFVTFEQSKFDHIREALVAIPLEKVLVETDAPFLAPEPYRGKPNEPAYVLEVAKKIATVKGIPVAEVSEQLLRNAVTIFRLQLVS